MKNILKQIWPEWEIAAELGEGAFGKVYHIRRRELGHTFDAALKWIRIPKDKADIMAIMAEVTDSRSATEYFRSIVEEFVEEFVLMERMKGNSNIVSYEDHKVIQHENDPGWDVFIRMELLTPFTRYMMENEITVNTVIRMGIDIAKALELCHKNNIIHRDIKPQNIFLSKEGDFKLGDFGVARIVEQTSLAMSKKGTYAYMAPEVYRGGAYDKTADIYSLGIMMYRLLNSNREPFMPLPPDPITFADKEKALQRRMDGDELPPPLYGNHDLHRIIKKAVAFHRQERYQTAEEMRIDLERLLVNPGKNTSSFSANEDQENDNGQSRLYKKKSAEETITVSASYSNRDGRQNPEDVIYHDSHAEKGQKQASSRNQKRDLQGRNNAGQNGNPDPKKNMWIFVAALGLTLVILVALVVSRFMTPGDPGNQNQSGKTEVAVKDDAEGSNDDAESSNDEIESSNDEATDESDTKGFQQNQSVDCGWHHIAGLKKDGSVTAAGDDKYGQCDVSNWTDITALSCGWRHTIGLKKDGTVIAAGGNDKGQCDVDKWDNITALDCGDWHTVGLQADGRVIATGDNSKGQCDLEEWTDIDQIICGDYQTVGIKKDKTVLAAGSNKKGQSNVEGWDHIVSVCSEYEHLVGLRDDGTVLATGENKDGRCDVEEWTDIQAISCGENHTVGLKEDGKVVAVGSNYEGQCDVDDWEDIIAIACGDSHTVGLKSDGTLVATGYNRHGECNVDEWENVSTILCGDWNTIGITKDGRLYVTGRNKEDHCEIGTVEE